MSTPPSENKGASSKVSNLESRERNSSPRGEKRNVVPETGDGSPPTPWPHLVKKRFPRSRTNTSRHRAYPMQPPEETIAGERSSDSFDTRQRLPRTLGKMLGRMKSWLPGQRQESSTPHAGERLAGSNSSPGTAAPTFFAQSELQNRMVQFCTNDEMAANTRVVRNEGNHGLEELHTILLPSFEIPFEDEHSFDLMVFNEMANFFRMRVSRLRGLSTPSQKEYTVMEYHPKSTPPRAIVLARQIRMDSVHLGLYIGPSSLKSRCDHAVLILVYQDNKWVREACTEVEEFKTDKTICNRSDFQLSSNKCVHTGISIPKSAAQAFCYVSSLVFPSMAYLGLSENTLPITVVSCRTKTDPKNKTFHFNGRLSKPDYCGKPFKCRIDEVDSSPESAVRLYVNSIAYGIRLARAGIKNLAEKDARQVIPLSGERLFPLSTSMDICWTATAVRQTNRIKVRFGDVSVGTMSVGSIRGILSQSVREICTLDRDRQDNEEVPVFVKASNALVHGMAVKSGSCFYAIENCQDILTQHTKLLGVIRRGAGLVTIMENLHSEPNYLTLTPCKWHESKKLGILWESFGRLTNNVLVPMAKNQVVYTDLRTGYDIMGNIKVSGTDTPDLQLIDFESILGLYSYQCPNDKRYIYMNSDYSATVFVFIQVFAVGISWAFKIDHNKIDARSIGRMIFGLLRREKYQRSLLEMEGLESKICDGCIDKLLEYFSGVFQAAKKMRMPQEKFIAEVLDYLCERLVDNV